MICSFTFRRSDPAPAPIPPGRKTGPRRPAPHGAARCAPPSGPVAALSACPAGAGGSPQNHLLPGPQAPGGTGWQPMRHHSEVLYEARG